MAELPEIHKFRTQMNTELSGKQIQLLNLLQDKCLNIPPGDFERRCIGSKIIGVKSKGKWFIIKLDNDESILLSLGMGADMLYHNGTETEAKYQIKLDFDDDSCFTIRFWWFGRFLIISEDDLATEPNISRIAIDPFDEMFTYEYFRQLFTGRKTQIKPFLLDQKNISGIGNMYMHDILFTARLHPQTKISDISDQQFAQLYHSILDTLRRSESKGAFAYEKDIYGNPGGFTTDDFLVGYKVNGCCPVCGHKIEQMKTGSTTSFVCLVCQKL